MTGDVIGDVIGPVLKLAVFDIDGTLIDSFAQIDAAMAAGLATAGLSPPARDALRDVIGLSLPQAVARLAPTLDADALAAAVAGYRAAYVRIGRDGGADAAPLYDGIAGALDTLAGHDPLLLGIATGKSRAGLMQVLGMHRLRRRFVTLQPADDHPSKPHPAMLLAAAVEAGCAPVDTVMIGDTVHDMAMARAAGMRAIAVTWGYHDAARLAAEAPAAIAESPADLPGIVADLLALEPM